MAESLDFIFERANSALITQDFQYAERLLKNVLKNHQDISPEDKEKIERLLARIYGDEGDLERSLAAYLRLYEREPHNVDLMINLGRIYRHLARYEDALKILEKAQKIGGETDEVLYNLAKTYKRMHKYDKAAEYFSCAIQLKPDHAHAYDRLGNLYSLTGETEKAIETYKNGLRMDPNHPYLNFHLAKLLQQEKRYEEAIVYYNTALRINPSWNDVLSGIASSYLHLDKLDDALNTYRSILRVSGETAQIYTELGHLFEKKQLQQEAEQYYDDALVIDPGYAPAALALTRLLEKKQQYTKALSKLLAAEEAPANADNQTLRLKAIQICLYAKDYTKARELFERLNKDQHTDLNTLKLKGQLYALTGAEEKAEAIFKTVLQAAPSALDFRYELAEQYILAQKYKEAQKQLKLFLKQHPTDVPALIALAKTEEYLNNPQTAYQIYQKILKLQPDSFEARSALARLFQQSGDTIEALQTANEILNLQSASETVDQTQKMAETLDLYEHAAESYMDDPLLMKNLDQLKTGGKPLYMTPAELNTEPAVPEMPTLKAVSEAEQGIPFDLLVKKTEKTEDLPEADEAAENLQLIETTGIDIPVESHPVQAIPSTDTQQTMIPASTGAPQPLTASDINMQPSPQMAPLTALLSQPQPPLFTEQTPQNTASDNSYVQLSGLPPQSTAAPVYHTFDEMNFSSPVEDLYIKRQSQTKPFHLTSQPDPALSRIETLNAYGTSIEFLRDIISDIDQKLDEKRYSQAVEVLAEKIAENLSRKLPLQPPGNRLPQQEPEEDTSSQPQKAADTTAAESQQAQEDENPEPAAIAETFNSDQDQKNLLWCHAKHTIKDSPAFEEYLNAAAPEQLVELFSYLHELFSFLPEEEREIFLNSSERLQIHYLIARLSGGIGLKERAHIIRQTENTIDTQPPYNNAAILSLLRYLRDLSSSLPDQELGLRIKQELEELIANISSVKPAP